MSRKWNDMRLTVYFDGQFWVGVVEDTDHDPPRVARHVFGSEPYDAEIARLVRGPMFSLLAEFALTARDGRHERIASLRPSNPKRRSREAAAAVREHAVSTHAQQVLQQQFEARKTERRTHTRLEREAAQERKLTLKRDKAKARHRGH
jgi:hypothetical protein